MAMVRVPPGTIPREEKKDERGTIKDFFRRQQLNEKLDEVDRSLRNSPITRDTYMQGRPERFSRPLVEPKKVERENLYQNPSKPQNIAFSEGRPDGYWGNNKEWKQLSGYQRAAAMALLEAEAKDGRPDFASARNALGAMINRADKEGEDLGHHVSRKIYQPTIEPAQYSRLQGIMQLPEFQALTALAERRDKGEVDDWVQGATHFLAKPEVMLRLEAEDPKKYRSWRGWTGFDETTGRYSNEVMADSSHVFLAPEGKHTADRAGLSIYGGDYSAQVSPLEYEQSGTTRPRGAMDSSAPGDAAPPRRAIEEEYEPAAENPFAAFAKIRQTGASLDLSSIAQPGKAPGQDLNRFALPPPPPRTPPHLPVPAQLPGAQRAQLGGYQPKFR